MSVSVIVLPLMPRRPWRFESRSESLVEQARRNLRPPLAIEAALHAVPDPLAHLVVALAQAYAAAGIVFAALFTTRGVDRIDPRAAGAGQGFRLLIVPGCALWWPWLAWRWRRARRGRTP